MVPGALGTFVVCFPSRMSHRALHYIGDLFCSFDLIVSINMPDELLKKALGLCTG